MKKKLLLTLICLAAVILGVILLWPLPFSNGITEGAELRALIVAFVPEDGEFKYNSINYTFQPDSDEYMRIQEILGKYSFHRSFRSFFSGASMDGNDAGYWLHLYSGEKSIILAGTKEVLVNNHVYRVGYWGNQKELAMMNEIRAVLEN